MKNLPFWITNFAAIVVAVQGSGEAIVKRMDFGKFITYATSVTGLFCIGAKDADVERLKKQYGLTDRDVKAAGDIGLIAINQLAHRLNLQVTPYDDNTDRDYRGSDRRGPNLLGVDGIDGESLRSGAGLNADTPFFDYGRGSSGDLVGASVAPGDDLRAIDAAQASAEQLRDRLGMPAKSVSPRVLKNWAEFNATAQQPAPIASSAIPFPEQDDDLVASESLPQWRS